MSTKTEPNATTAPAVKSLMSLLGSALGPFLALGVVFLFFAVADSAQEDGGNFVVARNVRAISVQTATVAVAALGMTVIIISGGIDLSAGTALALAATVLAWCLKEDVALLVVQGDNVAGIEAKLEAATKRAEKLDAALPEQRAELEHEIAALSERQQRIKQASTTYTPFTPLLSVVLALGVGCLTGLINGALISALRVVPFIVTLGTMTLYLGVAKIVAEETTVRPDKATQVPGWLGDFLSIRSRALYPSIQTDIAWIDNCLDYVRFPLGVWLTLILAVALIAVLRYTVFGRYVFALGSNESTARLCGINVTGNKLAVYALAGFFVGIGGLYQFTRLSTGNPTSGIGLELKIIAAVVIGGGSLSGGRGSVVGTLTGAAIMAVIASGCTQLGLNNPIQDIILGVIIIAAVALDQIRQRRLAD